MRASCRTPLRPQVATAHQDLPVSKSPPPGQCVCQTLALRTQGWFEAALLSIVLALAAPAAFAQAKPGLSLETGFAPAQDLTVWPLDISQGYPFVRGQVGGVTGVFLLDTGTPWGLLLNRARVDLPDTTFVLKATAGSGQSFDVVRASRMLPLVLHGQTWTEVQGVHAGDLGFVERGTGIGPLLGFIGANFFSNTALTLDYARRVAVIRRVQPETGAPLAALPAELAGGTVVASVRYRGDSASFPLFDALLGVTPVRVMLDSGNQAATLDAGWLADMHRAGAAHPFSRIGNETTYRTLPLQIGGMRVPLNEVVASDQPTKVAGEPDPHLLRVGFALLNRFGVTWNYRLQTLSFFTP